VVGTATTGVLVDWVCASEDGELVGNGVDVAPVGELFDCGRGVDVAAASAPGVVGIGVGDTPWKVVGVLVGILVAVLDGGVPVCFGVSVCVAVGVAGGGG
jgi:hypothetical protein